MISTCSSIQKSSAFHRVSCIPPAYDDGGWFNVLSADTPALREKVYRFRFQVYCLERGYEDPEDYPDHRETDSFDGHSVHSLLVNRGSGAASGTVRLVLADKDYLESSFPIQQVCRHPFFNDGLFARMKTTAEISRFAVSRNCGILSPSDPSFPGRRRRKSTRDFPSTLPSLTLGLMKATLQMSRQHGVTDWLAVMEPSLLRLLERFGIHFQTFGPLVEYHGLRQPCHAFVDNLLERVQRERPEVWRYVTDSGAYCP